LVNEEPPGLPAAYEGLEPSELWAHFAALNAIPRPSGHEEAARRYVQQVADRGGAPWVTDAAGNIVVRLAATVPGESPTVIVQSHLDMVCEALPSTAIDWLRDPIRPRRDGDVIAATGTTLGADNGIGAAAALALITTPGMAHGPLELLFTVQEEVGLIGALTLDGSLLEGRILVNLDSEDPEELTIGAAGGRDIAIAHHAAWHPLGEGSTGREITVSGLKGGHSGVQIDLPLANAVKVLAEILGALRTAGVDLLVGEISGGSRSNAIPREASARLTVTGGATEAFDRALAAAASDAQRAWITDEPGLRIEGRAVPAPVEVLGDADLIALSALLEALPHGVLAMSRRFPHKVQTSSNLAMVRAAGGDVSILVSVRSLDEDGLDEAEAGVREAAGAAGSTIEIAGAYPAWPPEPDSPLCQATIRAYIEAYGRPPRVEVIHAGLECGVIAAHLPGTEAISFGPLIVSPHTPDEYVLAPTVTSTWRLLTHLLAGLATSGS
jgi:dipeptidase D